MDTESGKPENVNVLLGSIAAFLAAIAGWMSRKAGKSPRPKDDPFSDPMRRELMKIGSRIDDLTSSLDSIHVRVVHIDERCAYFDSRISQLGRKVASMEGNYEGNGD